MVEKTAIGRAKHDPNVYRKNRSSHSLAELAGYGNQWVAWSADGSRVVAHHTDLLVVADQLKTQGVDMEDVVIEQIPPGGEIETLL